MTHTHTHTNTHTHTCKTDTHTQTHTHTHTHSGQISYQQSITVHLIRSVSGRPGSNHVGVRGRDCTPRSMAAVTGMGEYSETIPHAEVSRENTHTPTSRPRRQTADGTVLRCLTHTHSHTHTHSLTHSHTHTHTHTHFPAASM